MKTKLIVSFIALSAILNSCVDREENEIEKRAEKTINYKKEIPETTTFSKVIESDSLKTEILLNEQQTQPVVPAEGETVNPGDLGTPPTRP